MIIAAPGLWEMFQTLADGLIVAVAIILIQFDGLEVILCVILCPPRNHFESIMGES